MLYLLVFAQFSQRIKENSCSRLAVDSVKRCVQKSIVTSCIRNYCAHNLGDEERIMTYLITYMPRAHMYDVRTLLPRALPLDRRTHRAHT